MAADVLSAADGIIVSLFLAIQRPTIIACIAGIDHSAPMEEGNEATENTSTTPQPAVINISDTVDVSVSDPRQDLSPATKMRVLALALGLGSSSRIELPESRNSREEMQVSKSQGILAHPYAVDENHASFSSLKSIQYGMALGHPSQDVSRNVTPAFKNGSSEEDAMERSADIIISDRTSTPSRTEKIQMDDLIGRGRAARLLTTLRVHGSTPSVIESALPSTMDDKSSSRSRPVSALRQHPLPSSIHLDSRSQAPTPAHAFHSSPYLLRRALTPSRPYTSSDMLSEHSHPSEPATGTESSGRILAESIEDSVQSWPDVSRAGSSRAHHESTSERGTLGRRFPISTPLRNSMEDSTGHSVSLSVGRESSPSPLRLGESITSAITTAPIGRHNRQQEPGPRSSADIV
ncbi:hypothetical protein FRC17_005870 [Serendipita sp. 399]|nr:hypothetical protein FRC17_005870 [Serendipita sp. 399]